MWGDLFIEKEATNISQSTFHVSQDYECYLYVFSKRKLEYLCKSIAYMETFHASRLCACSSCVFSKRQPEFLCKSIAYMETQYSCVLI